MSAIDTATATDTASATGTAAATGTASAAAAPYFVAASMCPRGFAIAIASASSAT